MGGSSTAVWTTIRFGYAMRNWHCIPTLGGAGERQSCRKDHSAWHGLDSQNFQWRERKLLRLSAGDLYAPARQVVPLDELVSRVGEAHASSARELDELSRQKMLLVSAARAWGNSLSFTRTADYVTINTLFYHQEHNHVGVVRLKILHSRWVKKVHSLNLTLTGMRKWHKGGSGDW